MSLSLPDRLAASTRNLDRSAVPMDPPPWALRAIGWGLIAMFATLIVAAAVVDVPDTVQCPYVLVPNSGADPIQAPLLAIVEQVRVVEGQEVEAGAPLFVLRSDEVRGWQTQLRMLREDLAAKHGTIEKLEAFHASEIKIRESEVEQYERELEFQRQRLVTGKDILQRLETLKEQGLLSVVQMMEQNINLAEMEKNASLTQKALGQAVLERKNTQTEQGRRLMEERSELEKIHVRIRALEAQLSDSEGALLTVRAPYHGIVIALKERNSGTVVQSGNELCQLARADGELHARLLLEEQGLARVAPKQRVRLFFDAFPSQRYGTITGKLDWVSPAAVASTNGQQFVGLASLDQTTITVEGRPRPLQVGMKGYARIVVGRRPLAEIVFEPVRQLREFGRP